MTTERVMVGNVEIVSVTDGMMPAHPSFMFSGVPPEMYEAALHDELTPEGTLPIKRGSFLVRSAGRTILVDTGIGEKNPDLPGGELLSNLERLGVRLDEIDVVVNTHLHFDHVGWNCSQRDGEFVPTFPRAEYWIARKEWDFWTDPAILADEGSHLRTDVLPLKDSPQLRLIDGEAAITPELSLMPTPGHTPGHTSSRGVFVWRAGDHFGGRCASSTASHPLLDSRH